MTQTDERATDCPRVYSRRKGAQQPPPGAVYVGRPTRWGNAFEIGRDGTREEVVEKYIELPGGGRRKRYRIPLQGLLTALPGTYDLGADLAALATLGDAPEQKGER